MGLLIRMRYIVFVTLLLNSQILLSQIKIDRVEPAFWWAGMQHQEVMVMLYGDNIGELQPSFAYTDLELARVVKTDNNNYLFLYLNIGQNAQPGTFEITLSKNGKPKTTFTYEIKKRRQNSAFRQGFNSSDVMCLLYPDRFANGDSQNDNVEGYSDQLNRTDDYGRHGGDIQGIIDHLDYIKEMGFTALWLNPVFENNMPSASYHGYAATDFYKVDPRLGSNELYVKLSDEAHKRGIKLIKDMIMNHCGSNHWWMADPPSNDWVHYQDNFKVTNHRRHVMHDPYASQADKQLFEDGWFVEAMPDMNQRNPLLADYLIYNSIWWIEYANLDGLRHDTHPYSGVGFMNRWTRHIMEEYPNFNIVGEEWSHDPAVLAKWQRGSNLPVDFASCLPSLMDFPIQATLVEALREDEGWNTGFIKLYEKLASDYLYPDPNNLVIFPDNHDMDRFYRQVNNDLYLYKIGMTYIATMRGIPQIQYGTELLMSNEKGGDHGQIREDFPGGWKGDNVNGFTGENLSADQAEAQIFTKKLLNWRKNTPLMHNGKLMQFAPTHDGIYVYFRYNDENAVMVVLNKNDQPSDLDTKRFNEITYKYQSGKDVITGKDYNLENMSIPGRQALIIELK